EAQGDRRLRRSPARLAIAPRAGSRPPYRGILMAQLSLRGLAKRFGEVEAVRGVDLDVAHEEFVVLVGPSGCGKSTILRMIAGLEEATAGGIPIGGRPLNHTHPK